MLNFPMSFWATSGPSISTLTVSTNYNGSLQFYAETHLGGSNLYQVNWWDGTSTQVLSGHNAGKFNNGTLRTFTITPVTPGDTISEGGLNDIAVTNIGWAKCPNFTYLSAVPNTIPSLNLTGLPIQILDLADSSALTTLNFGNLIPSTMNFIILTEALIAGTISFANFTVDDIDIELCPHITNIDITDCSNLSALYLVNNNALTQLTGLGTRFNMNQFTINNCLDFTQALDFSGLYSLFSVSLYMTNVPSVTFDSNNYFVDNIDLSFTPITTIDFTNLTSLTGFTARNSALAGSFVLQNNVIRFDVDTSPGITDFQVIGYTGTRGSSSTPNISSLANCSLSDTSLNTFFTTLGMAQPYNTLDVSGNPGSATCDPTIATALGFTVLT